MDYLSFHLFIWGGGVRGEWVLGGKRGLGLKWFGSWLLLVEKKVGGLVQRMMVRVGW